MKVIIYLILPSLLYSCSKGNEPRDTEPIIVNWHQNTVVKDTVLNTPIETAVLLEIKKIIDVENKKRCVVTPLVITNIDSIRTYLYIKETFQTNHIDSIEFYGSSKQNFKREWHLPMNSLLVLYYNSIKIAQMELTSLQDNWSSEGAEATFKPGGMAFIFENQLYLYSINTCGSYNNVLRLDSLIKHNAFVDNSFTRLHTKCGMVPFKKLVD